MPPCSRHRRLRAARLGRPRLARHQVSHRPQGLLQEGDWSPVQHVLNHPHCASIAGATAAVVARRRPRLTQNTPRKHSEQVDSGASCPMDRSIYPRAPENGPALLPPWANLATSHARPWRRGHARPTAHDCRGGRRAALGRIALQEQARPSKPSAPPSQQAHHPAAHAGAHSAPQRSHTRVHSTQLTRPAFSVPIAVLFRPRRTGHTRLPPPPSR